MAKQAERLEQIATDLFNFGGGVYSIPKLCRFLQCSRKTAEGIVSNIDTPMGQQTGKRYYFRDIAEVLANVR